MIFIKIPSDFPLSLKFYKDVQFYIGVNLYKANSTYDQKVNLRHSQSGGTYQISRSQIRPLSFSVLMLQHIS
jgi:hypothetical protein